MKNEEWCVAWCGSCCAGWKLERELFKRVVWNIPNVVCHILCTVELLRGTSQAVDINELCHALFSFLELSFLIMHILGNKGSEKKTS